MLSSKKSRGLGLSASSISPYQRKYLGESNDPHFVPKSPLIERQKFSDKDEAELRKLCAEALADVPHSDAMIDDPFRYMVRQRSNTNNTSKAQQDKPTVSTRKERAPSVPLVQPHQALSSSQSSSSKGTANSSTSHKFKTNDTTAVTTPGAPGKTDSHRPSTTSCTAMGKGDSVYSFMKEHSATSRPVTSITTRSMTSLSTGTPRRKSRTAIHDAKAKLASLGNPNFNKSLPALPRIPTREDRKLTEAKESKETKEKTGALNRMLRTVRLQRTQSRPNMAARSISTNLPPQLDVSPDQVDEVTAKKQRRFNISHIFHKNNGPKRATVC